MDRLEARWRWLAVAVGVAGGLLYLLSPVTAWVAAGLALLVALATRGLPAFEQRQIWTLVGLAVALRAALIAGLFLTSAPGEVSSFFWDGDGVYLKYRALVIRSVWLGAPVSETDFVNAFSRTYGWTSYINVLAYIQWLLGPAPHAVHLVNVAAFVAAALVLFRLTRPAYGAVTARLGLAVMLFLPTLLAWSVAALKEAVYILLCVIALWAAVTALRSGAWLTRVGAALLLWLAVAANGTVRMGALVIMAAGLAFGVVSSVVVRRVALTAGVAVVSVLAAPGVWQRPEIQGPAMVQLRAAAVTHVGNVRTTGNHYKVLDQRVYSDNAVTRMTPEETRRYVLRALVAFVLVPLPWQVESPAEMVFLGQQVVWYLMVAFATVGIVAGVRRDRVLTCLLVGFALAGSATIALNSGNIGTMVRFRDTVTPFIIWLSALGAVELCARIGRGRIGHATH